MTSVTIQPQGIIKLPPQLMAMLGISIGGELEIEPTQTGLKLNIHRTKPSQTPAIDADKLEHIMAFAGSWQDNIDDIFAVEAIEARRQATRRFVE